MSYNFNAEAEIVKIKNWIADYFDQQGEDCKAVIGISGGKDSLICAKLLVDVLGQDRVYAVMMPNGEQKDISDSLEACHLLGLNHYSHFNIENIYNAFMDKLCDFFNADSNAQITQNLPPRIRTATLYAFAAGIGHCRVCNTSNLTEIMVGYSTKWGDNVGDFGLLRNYTVTEVLAIGDALGLPQNLVHKPPADGLTGSTDEEVLGFKYAEVDKIIRLDNVTDLPENINKRFSLAAHKSVYVPSP